MDNSTYVPSSPSLMVLASTADAAQRDAAMQQQQQHMSGGGSSGHHFAAGAPGGVDGSGKDVAQPPPQLHVPFSAASFAAGLPPSLYGSQASDGFAHLLHMHAPFLHAPGGMERALGFISPTGGGAFRPVSSSAAAAAAAAALAASERGNNGFHSAFVPPKCGNKMSADQSSGMLNQHHHSPHHHHQHQQHHHHQQQQQQQQQQQRHLQALHAAAHSAARHGLSLGGVVAHNNNNNSMLNNNNGGGGMGGGCKVTYSLPSSAFGLNLSTGGVGGGGGHSPPLHIKDEGGGGGCSSDHDTSGSERLTGTPCSDITDATERSTPDEARLLKRAKKRSLFDGQSPCCPVCGVTIRNGEFEVHFIQEVERLSKISRLVKKSSSKESPPKSSTTPIGSANNSKKSKDSPNQGVPEKVTTPESRWDSFQRVRTNRQGRLSVRSKVKKRRQNDETICPICSERVSGTPDELNAHAERCIRKRELNGEEDEPVDVEGEAFEEYEWAGQTRIRATSMLQGGFAASGFQTSSRLQGDDDDIDLNVDGDDSATYGQSQYGEADVIPCSCDEPGEDKERQALRGALLTGSGATPHIKMESDTWSSVERYSGSPEDSENNDNRISSSGESYLNHSRSVDTTSGLEQIVESLKSRLREMEGHQLQSHQLAIDGNRPKCKICMETYNVPLVSVSCWHVHCEECWLRTLGAKKLCPQCNMITSPTDLRRVYL